MTAQVMVQVWIMATVKAALLEAVWEKILMKIKGSADGIKEEMLSVTTASASILSASWIAGKLKMSERMTPGIC